MAAPCPLGSYSSAFLARFGFLPYTASVMGWFVVWQRQPSMSQVSRTAIPFCVEDDAADELGDLWYYGVSEDAKSVQPRGNPMSHSTHVGFSGPRSCKLIRSGSCTE